MANRPKDPPSLRQRLEHRLGRRSVWWLTLLVIIGVASLAVRLLFYAEQQHSALLYLLIPYSLAMFIAVLIPRKPPVERFSFTEFALSSLLVLLGSSVVLGEGFICVLFFLPFYFLVLALVAVTRALLRRGDRESARRRASIVPALVLLLSLEGTAPALTFQRSNQVERTMDIPLAPAQILKNMERPIQLGGERHWILDIFPMPETLSGHELVAGAQHALLVHYPRWFVTNVHSGTLVLEIVRADEHGVLSQVVEDGTLFSNYLSLQQFEVRLEPVSATHTRAALSIRYQRELDPSWYFQPVMRFAVARMADHLLEELLHRGE